MRVILVEDNAQLAKAIVEGLAERGFDVEAVDTAAAGIARGLQKHLDVMVLDLGLPDRDGLDVLRELRAARIYVPILVLTAREDVETRIAALDEGADDFFLKPFVFGELVARISALVRRAGGPRWMPSSSVPLALRDDHVVESGGKSASLSPREFALLGCLVRRCGEVVTRADILRDAFGYDFDPGTNVVDVHLTHLRRKLTGFPITIESVRGAGIRLLVKT